MAGTHTATKPQVAEAHFQAAYAGDIHQGYWQRQINNGVFSPGLINPYYTSKGTENPIVPLLPEWITQAAVELKAEWLACH